MKPISLLLTMAFLLFSSFTYAEIGDLTPTQVRQAQEQLKNAGFDPGPIDGILGPRTNAALRQYQTKYGLPVTGFFDEATRKALEAGEERIDITLKPLDSTQAPTQTPPPPASAMQSVPEELTEPHAGEGDIRQIDAGTQALKTADWVRLVLLLVLGLVAQGLRRWFIASAFGSVLAFLIHGFMEWSWVWSFEAGLAAAYTLPLLVSTLWENFRITLAFAVLLGGPTFFVSRFLFDSSWIFAAADTVAFMHLAPMAIIRVLVAMRIIELPTKTNELPPHGPLKEQESVYRAGAPDRASSSPLEVEDRSYRTSSSPLRFPRNRFP